MRITDEMIERAQLAADALNVMVSARVMRAALSAALSIEQTEPVKVRALEWTHHDGNYPTWRTLAPHFEAVIDKGEPRMYGEFPLTINGRMSKEKYGTLEAAQAAAQADFERRVGSFMRSALVNAQADADVVERWQPIDTAPRDGTPVDLWGVNHLHPRKTGRRATDVTWGRVRDWLGNERDDWQHGQGDDFEPTHWCPVPAAPLSSLRPAEVGSATKSSGIEKGSE